MNPSRQASFSLARVLRLVTGLLVVGSLVACSSLTPPAQTSGPVPFLRLDMDGQVAAAQATADGATLPTGLDAEPALPPIALAWATSSTCVSRMRRSLTWP
ncbi:hypothetical protein [Ideonella paludis]|uniref:hypothetical protein n=1 Tax=Ideonella paludis TaxID=1233411 RepID=UPI0036421ED0